MRRHTSRAMFRLKTGQTRVGAQHMQDEQAIQDAAREYIAGEIRQALSNTPYHPRGGAPTGRPNFTSPDGKDHRINPFLADVLQGSKDLVGETPPPTSRGW